MLRVVLSTCTLATLVGLLYARPIIIESVRSGGVPGTYTAIPLNKKENQVSDKISDVFRKQASVSVQRLGGENSFSSLNINSFSGYQIGIYINGILLDSFLAESTSLDDMPKELFDRIQLYAFYIPSHLGGMHIGGAFNIIPKHIPHGTPPYIFLKQRYSSLLNQSISFGYVQPNAKHYIKVNIGANHYAYLNNRGTTILNSSDDTHEVRQNEDYRNVEYSGFFDLKTPNHVINFFTNYLYNHRGIPGTASHTIDNVRHTIHRVLVNVIHTTWLAHSAIGIRLKNYISGQNSYTFLTDPKKEFIRIPEQKRLLWNITGGTELRLYFFDDQIQISQNANTYANIMYRSLDNNVYAPFAQRLTTDIGTTLEYRPLMHVARTAFTAKGNHIYDRPQADLVNTQLVNKIPSTSSEFLFALSGLLSIYPLQIIGKLWKIKQLQENINRPLEIYTMISRSARAPNITEKYGNGNFTLPNVDLVKESSLTYMAGVKKNIIVREIQWKQELQFFEQKGENLISFIFISNRFLKAENVSATFTRGVNITSSLSWLNYFYTAISFSFLDAIDKGIIAFYKNKALPFRPKYKFTTYTEMGNLSTKLFINTLLLSSLFRDRFNSDASFVLSRFRLDIGIHYQLPKKQVKMSFTIANILNNQAQDRLGYPLPGIHYTIHFQKKWGVG